MTHNIPVEALQKLSKEQILALLATKEASVPQPQTTGNKFDLKTHHFDAKGNLMKKNPYRLHIMRGVKYFERPVGSGNLFFENNEPAGRVNYDLAADGLRQKKTFDFKAEHKAYTPPPSGAEQVVSENAELKQQNEALAKELEAIRAEAHKTANPKPAVSEPEKSAKVEEAPKPAEAKKPSANELLNGKPKVDKS